LFVFLVYSTSRSEKEQRSIALGGKPKLMQTNRNESEKLAVSIREAAAMLSISPRSVQNYLRLKLLRGRKLGRRTVIPVRALEAFLRVDQPSPTKDTPAQ